MNYYSLHKKAPNVSFKEAVINGIAPDKGLYFPEIITPLSTHFWDSIRSYSKEEVAMQLIAPFVGNAIDRLALEKIIAETVSFPFPLVNIEDNIHSLELFHGPTMAFKDVGARFMARCLGYFAEISSISQEVTVLVATSGDTGGAVASGFLGVEGVRVVILYPSGKVSDIQEKQLTTLGQNITALEVDGTFDDCQAIVKEAFLDTEITKRRKLTSANSINVARWLPQSFYFAYAFRQVNAQDKNLVFSVPSGNFGNICAGMVVQHLGMPVAQFVASVNDNDVIPKFFQQKSYQPQPSVATISNAMDVGDPSNFIRIQELFKNDFKALSKQLTSYSFSDAATRLAMKELYTNHNYIADPHGAVGYLGLKKYMEASENVEGIFLETAHPVKFLATVEATISEEIKLSEEIKQLIKKEKEAIYIKNYQEFKAYMLQS